MLLKCSNYLLHLPHWLSKMFNAIFKREPRIRKLGSALALLHISCLRRKTNLIFIHSGIYLWFYWLELPVIKRPSIIFCFFICVFGKNKNLGTKSAYQTHAMIDFLCNMRKFQIFVNFENYIIYRMN